MQWQVQVQSTRLANRCRAGFEFELGIPVPQGHESTTEESDVDGTKARDQTPDFNIGNPEHMEPSYDTICWSRLT